MREAGFDQREVHKLTIALRKLIEVGDGKCLDRSPIFMDLKCLGVGKEIALHIISLADLTDEVDDIRFHATL